MAFTYTDGIPKVNEAYLKAVDVKKLEKAQGLYDGVGLGHYPKNDSDKDKRWQRRIVTLGIAEDSRRTWLKMKDSEFKEDELKQIITMATQTGFFSIWMMVFQDDTEVKCELIKAFPGTAARYFDKNGCSGF